MGILDTEGINDTAIVKICILCGDLYHYWESFGDNTKGYCLKCNAKITWKETRKKINEGED